MKKKMYLAVLAAMGMAAFGGSMSVYAGTYGVEKDAVTSEMDLKAEKYEKELLRERVVVLKEYGVTYNEKEGSIYYQDKKVRWLIDEVGESAYSTSFFEEGGIDLYTVRNDDMKLTGVRESTKEEFEEISDENFLAEEEGHYVVKDEIAAWEISENIGETYAIAIQSAELSKEEQERQKLQDEEYEKAGITRNANGQWMWKEKEIYILMDENGDMTQHGAAKAGSVYLYVNRDNKGNITSVEEVTGKGILQKKAESDEKAS